MRMNELISGVRADVAIKVYGDDLDTLVEVGKRIEAGRARRCPGAADVKLEQTTGLPMLTVTPDRQALARYGLNPGEVQDDGRHRDRRQGGRPVLRRRSTLRHRRAPARSACARTRRGWPICRFRSGGTRQRRRSPVAAANWAGGDAALVPLREVARIEDTAGPEPDQSRERQASRGRHGQRARPRSRRLRRRAAQRVDAEVEVPTGYWIDYGGTFEQLISASQRLRVVVPVTLVDHLRAAVHGVRLGAGRGDRFSGVPLALTGGVVALWLRGHSAVDLGGRRLHRAVRRRRAQRPGDDRLHPQAARAGRSRSTTRSATARWAACARC